MFVFEILIPLLTTFFWIIWIIWLRGFLVKIFRWIQWVWRLTAFLLENFRLEILSYSTLVDWSTKMIIKNFLYLTPRSTTIQDVCRVCYASLSMFQKRPSFFVDLFIWSNFISDIDINLNVDNMHFEPISYLYKKNERFVSYFSISGDFPVLGRCALFRTPGLLPGINLSSNSNSFFLRDAFKNNFAFIFHKQLTILFRIFLYD